jgi:hypothetical protein
MDISHGWIFHMDGYFTWMGTRILYLDIHMDIFWDNPIDMDGYL